MVDFVLTAIPVFAALQFLLAFLSLYGTSFAAARATVIESRQLALADRERYAAERLETTIALDHIADVDSGLHGEGRAQQVARNDSHFIEDQGLHPIEARKLSELVGRVHAAQSRAIATGPARCKQHR